MMTLRSQSSLTPGRSAAKPIIRCAIYTRKSTEEGLQQEFNSLDAQREAAEAYIASQKAEGWTALPDHYDDGGYSGGSMDRPGLERLLRDIDAGKIDCVVVYKVDRLSRSLLDFAKIMETFDRHGVSFVSVTQQFNTTHSMGRLTLNILIALCPSPSSSGKLPRSERGTRLPRHVEMVNAQGGPPILGYDIVASPTGSRLVVNPEEAGRVRQTFELYLEQGALLPTVQELTRRGWTRKRWQTRRGHVRGGFPFDRTSLYALLTNVTYTGRVSYKSTVYPGQHEAIVPMDLWQRVQAQLQKHGRSGGAEVRNPLRGTAQGHSALCALRRHHDAYLHGQSQSAVSLLHMSKRTKERLEEMPQRIAARRRD